MPLPHRHHQKAAEGWLMLGNPIEAMAELDLIPDIYRQRMDVLTLHWTVCSALRRWDEAWTVANAQWALYPEAVESWIHRSYAARRHTGGSIAKAFGLLEPAVDLFRRSPSCDTTSPVIWPGWGRTRRPGSASSRLWNGAIPSNFGRWPWPMKTCSRSGPASR